ncbi:MAG: hypothetical protein R3E32_10335 [Chitinophagales bacterium]
MKNIDPQLLELIERYVADELSEAERMVFENQLEQDPEIGEALDFFMAFEAEKEDFGRILMKEELRKIDAAMEQKAKPAALSIIAEEVLQKIADLTHKTIEEVSRLFQPIPEYHVLQLATDRSDTVKVKTPPIGEDYTNGTLIFELEQPGNYVIIVENNRRAIVFQKRLQKNERMTQIEVSGYPMGVYYWKLTELSKDWMQVGHFFVTLVE